MAQLVKTKDNSLNDTRIACFDSDEETLNALKNGDISILADQQPYAQGYLVFFVHGCLISLCFVVFNCILFVLQYNNCINTQSTLFMANYLTAGVMPQSETIYTGPIYINKSDTLQITHKKCENRHLSNNDGTTVYNGWQICPQNAKFVEEIANITWPQIDEIEGIIIVALMIIGSVVGLISVK